MKRQPFSKTVSDKYIKDNLENNEILSFLDYKQEGAQSFYFDELNKQEVRGFPFSSDFVDSQGHSYSYREFAKLSLEDKKACRLRFFYLPNYHELYIGTTGSGKTTGCIEPELRAVAAQQNKANLFITDPKGELFEHHARYLKEQGYQLFILNFKNLARSHTWNPLEEMYDTYQELKFVGEGTKQVNEEPTHDLQLMSNEKDYQGHYILYKDMAFATDEQYQNYLEVERYMVRSKASTLINQFCNTVFNLEGIGDDRSWIEGARGFMYGILLAMLEESISEPGFKRQHMTLKTVNDIFALLRDGAEDIDEETADKMDDFLRNKSPEVMNKLKTVIKTAPVTRKGYLSVFQSEVEKWMQGHIFQLTGSTTVRLEDKNAPWAIFIATRDYDKADNVIAGLFIDWVYRQSLIKIEKERNAGEKPREIHFLLDEFANIPRIPDFDNKIATARSRGMWFHLFIQSYDQLDLIYGKETANIIIDNCNQQTFLGSQSQATKERFSRECGQKTVQSLDGLLNGEPTDLVQVAVVQTTALDRIIPGEMYTHRIYSPVIKCSFIRSYQCAEVGVFTNFYDAHAFNDLTPVNISIPDNMEATYLPIVPHDYFSRKKKEPFFPEEEEEEEDDDITDLNWDDNTPISDDEEEEEKPEENLNQNEEENDTINTDNQNNQQDNVDHEEKEEDQTLEDLISEIFKKDEKGDKK